MEHVKVILLRRVAKLGHIGDVVNVKPGFARNYLLPQKIALRATKDNLKRFEEQKVHIEAANAESRAEAQKIAEKMAGLSLSIVRQASDKGHLYGSVSSRDIAAAIKEAGFSVTAGQINLNAPIKTVGIYDISVDLHPEVSVIVKLSVAKSEEEARQQISDVPVEASVSESEEAAVNEEQVA
ncbi:MAG: 50S ribosomal protein L9 [Holosporales bacterium]|jgi:large subunit ribosomal protein L9|nr:50S ribosomal protein L9 [Holosporales bacterium]